MTHSVPAHLVKEQFPAMVGMTTGLLWSMTPDVLKSRLVDRYAERVTTVSPASEELVNHYAQWAGAPAERYAQTLPPHFFSKYGMSMVAGLTGQVPYNLMSVLNQGCRFQINGLIPRNTPITLKGRLVECRKEGSRVRIHTRVEAGTAAQPDAMVVDTVAAVIVGSREPKAQNARQDPEFTSIGQWSADRDDGKRFFYLTGDFNPIHTFWPLARRSRFGGCILHGFGSVARTYETIQKNGFEINDFDVRFVKPNPLPCRDLAVQISEPLDDGRRALRLVNAAGDVFLAGAFATNANGEANSQAHGKANNPENKP